MKVGFLHGCCQDNPMFKSIMKPYCDVLIKNYGAEVVFIEGEYDHSRKGRTWFRSEFELSSIGIDIPEEEVEMTLNIVETIIRKENIEILIGFSQGGNVMDTYLRTRNSDNHIKRAMIMNAYTFPRYSQLKPSLDKLVIVTSEVDDIVRCNLLQEDYDNCKKFFHEGGHKVATRKPLVRSFLAELFAP